MSSLSTAPSLPASSRPTIHSAGLTIAGRRGNNEDQILVAERLRLFGVADGLGGYEGGEVASAIAVKEIEAFFAAIEADREHTWPFSSDPALSPEGNLVDQAIRLAHRAVCEARPRAVNMATTIALFRFSGEHVVVGHVGDSRVYRLRHNTLTQLTSDHSMAEELRAMGVLGPDDEAPRHLGHLVTKALGLPGWHRPTLMRERWQPGDRYLACSDGLSGTLSSADIALLMAHRSPRAAVEQLVHTALEAGSTDNISAVLAAPS